MFNKKSARHAKQDDLEDIKWGDDNEFSVMNSVNSVTAWFASQYAAKYKLGPETLRDFEFCVIDGKLVTLGMDALWASDEMYREKYTSYETHKKRKRG